MMQFFISNYGKEITDFVIREVKQRVEENSTKKMWKAAEKAREAEQQAESVKDAKLKMEYFELAKRFQEEVEYQKRFLSDINESIEEASEEIAPIIQENTKNIKVEDVMIKSKKDKKLKAGESNKLIKPLPENKNK